MKKLFSIAIVFMLASACSNGDSSAQSQSDLLNIIILASNPSCSVDSTESTTSGCTRVTTKCCQSSDSSTCTYNVSTSCN
ncbi:MAG: hypothetical protein KDK39_08055 [Leptospiraceae bacterium]|nr:hypothetical protein [Leptospiraceae bacterium]